MRAQRNISVLSIVVSLGLPMMPATTAADAAADAAGEQEFLRERVEALGSGRLDRVEGATIAAGSLLEEFYARCGFRPAWTAPGKPDQLLAAIRAIADDGLDPEDYHLSVLETVKARIPAAPVPDLALRVDYDLLLTDALVRLGYHVLFGKVDYAEYDADWNYSREIHDLDPAVAIQQVIDEPDIAAAIEREKPSHAAYAALRARYVRYRAIRDAGGWGRVEEGPTLRPGDVDIRVNAVRSRLVTTGDLPVAAGFTPGDVYDDALADAVRAFQRRHGLDADAAVGPRTVEEMNVPVEVRLDKIRLNLERERWLLHDIGGEFVIVNIAGFELYYVEDGKVVWKTRVQVGKPYRSTPVFRSEITYLVFNPTWTVPPGILANDILPEQKNDPATLSRKGLKILDSSGREIDPATIDWSRYSGRGFPYTLRQDPGPKNALGRVKFMFPNEHAVYLHDTPSKSLFEKEDRAFSSGCIRVEEPLHLAELLLRHEPGWRRSAIDSAIATGELRSVTLATPVPILLSYWTAWVEEGALQFRRDLYDRDAKVLAGLNQPFRLRARHETRPHADQAH